LSEIGWGRGSIYLLGKRGGSFQYIYSLSKIKLLLQLEERKSFLLKERDRKSFLEGRPWKKISTLTPMGGATFEK